MQLLERQWHRVLEDDASILIVDPPDSPAIEALTRPRAEFWIRHHGIARRAALGTSIVTDALWTPPADRFDRALIFLPKGKRLQKMTFSQVAAGLRQHADVFVVGQNQAGIKSTRTALNDAFGDVEIVDAARRCTLLRAKTTAPSTPFDPDAWPLRWTATIGSAALALTTFPGTFSDGALDDGTAELLDVLQSERLEGRVLDMGCGCGVIGAYVARFHPCREVVLADANAAAVASTTATLAQNGLTNASVVPSEWYSELDGSFDAIVTNPPFHEGIETNMTMADAVIGGAAARLTPKGSLWLVANRFLPYLDSLRDRFERVEIVRETKRYRVYRGQVPKKSGRQPSFKGSSRNR